MVNIVRVKSKYYLVFKIKLILSYYIFISALFLLLNYFNRKYKNNLINLTKWNEKIINKINQLN